MNIVQYLTQEGAFSYAQEEEKTALHLAQVESHNDIVTTFYQAAPRRDTDIVAQSSLGAAPGRTDIVFKPENPLKIHKLPLAPQIAVIMITSTISQFRRPARNSK